MRRLSAAAVVGLLAYLATGVSVVQQDELGVVRRFGAVLREPWEPGLHWASPGASTRSSGSSPARRGR